MSNTSLISTLANIVVDCRALAAPCTCADGVRFEAAQVEASQEALSTMPHKNYGKFARWAQSQKLGMVKQVRVRLTTAAWHSDGTSYAPKMCCIPGNAAHVSNRGPTLNRGSSTHCLCLLCSILPLPLCSLQHGCTESLFTPVVQAADRTFKIVEFACLRY